MTEETAVELLDQHDRARTNLLIARTSGGFDVESFEQIAAERRAAVLARMGPGWRPSEEDLTIVARSIGRTMRVPDHGRRAQDVFRSLRERDLTWPPSPSKLAARPGPDGAGS